MIQQRNFTRPSLVLGLATITAAADMAGLRWREAHGVFSGEAAILCERNASRPALPEPPATFRTVTPTLATRGVPVGVPGTTRPGGEPLRETWRRRRRNGRAFWCPQWCRAVSEWCQLWCRTAPMEELRERNCPIRALSVPGLLQAIRVPAIIHPIVEALRDRTRGSARLDSLPVEP